MTALTQAKAALAAALAGLCLSSAAVAADAYPSKPIRLIVPFAAGGTTDIVARIVSEGLTRELGQAVVVENRGGGGGSIGADALVRSTPDGYTLGVATVSTMATNPATNPQNPYNPIKDFTPITNLVNVPNVLTVNLGAGQDPGRIHHAAQEQPGQVQLCLVRHRRHQPPGRRAVQVADQYRHGARALPRLGPGAERRDRRPGQRAIRQPALFHAPYPGRQAARLAIEAPKRLPSLPDVPNFGEAGLPQMDNMAWYGLVAPAGTRRPWSIASTPPPSRC